MKHKLLTFVFLWVSITFSFSQTELTPNEASLPDNLEEEKAIYRHHCGTPPKTTAQREHSIKAKKDAVYVQKNAGTTCIGIAAHIVREDDGSGGLTLEQLTIGVGNLNYRFLEAGIEFFVCSVDYANSSDYMEFDGQAPDSDLEADLAGLFTESTEAANLYFVNSITLSSGFAASGYAYYPCDNIICSRSLMTIGSTASSTTSTFPHEFGHFFGLAHTHDGTEDGSGDVNAERVTRNAPDANCTTHGDGFCDTDADPKYAGADFDYPNCAYTGAATDDLSATYAPISAIPNIMSYYPDGCTVDFSPEQYAYMGAVGLPSRLGHTAYDIDGCTPTTVTPVSGLSAVQNGSSSIDLTWTDNASNEMGYLIERSTTSATSGFRNLPFGGAAADATAFSDGNIASNTTYWYRIKAVNGDCNSYSNVVEITTTLAYCGVTYNNDCSLGVYFDDVVVDGDGANDINNTGNGCGATNNYSDFTNSHSAVVTAGNTYNINISLHIDAGSCYAQNMTAYVDFNKNGDFTDPGEDFPLTYGACLVSGSITIPYCTLAGETILRLTSQFEGHGIVDDPCGTYSYGETEDYTLDIQSGIKIPSNTGSIIAHTADYVCTDDEGWSHYWDNVDGVDGGTDDQLLLSLSHGTSGLSISPGDVTLRTGNTEAAYYADGTGFINTGEDYGVLMERTYNVDYNGSLSDDVGVRFYYNTSEYNSVNAAIINPPVSGSIPLSAHSDMIFYKVTSADDPWDIPSIMNTEVAFMNFGASSSTSTWVYTNLGADIHYGEFKVASFSGGGVGGANGGAGLPVELANFQGKKDGSISYLYWKTESEINNDHFILERSSNGFDYENLGHIAGSGNSVGPIDYNFIDKNPILGVNYYRLIQVDIDGKETIYGPIQLTFNKSGTLEVFPVPTKSDNLNLIYDSENEGIVNWEIVDVQGKILQQGNLTVKEGVNQFKLKDVRIHNGLYFMRLRNNNTVLTKRFILMN